MAAFGVEVDRLTIFDATAMQAVRQAMKQPPQLFGGIAIYLNCPFEDDKNHEDHDHDHPTLMYRELPGVTITSPQPDVFVIHSEVDDGETETFISLVTAVAFFTERVGEAMVVPPEVKEMLQGLSDFLNKMMSDYDSDDDD